MSWNYHVHEIPVIYTDLTKPIFINLVYLVTIFWASVSCQSLSYVLVFQRLIWDRLYIPESHVLINENVVCIYIYKVC